MKKKLFIISSVVLIVIIGILITLIIVKNNNYKKSDAYKFKSEYEALNDTKTESGTNYNNVDIPKDNPIKYVSVKEAISIIKNKTGIVYFGAAWCPWCRNAVSVLFDACKDKNVDTIYYLNMDKVRNVYEVKNGKLVKTQKEQDGYYELLSLLDSVLDDETYKVSDDNEVEYDTSEKRIYMPFVISVKDGKILKTHEGTTDLNDNQTAFDKLTKKQYNELYNTYIDLINSVYSNDTCSVNEKCS